MKTIRTLIFPPTESDRAVATIEIPAYVHDNIHSEAAKRGLSIVDFIVTMLDFFLSGVNSHLLTHEIDKQDYEQKERIWQEDLQQIVSEHDNWARYSKAIEIA